MIIASLIQRRGQARRGPAADRGGACENRLQRRHAAADRRDPPATRQGGRRPAHRRRLRPRLAVQHVPEHGPAADADLDGDHARRSQAALHPADVPYMFYVLTDENGKHAFADHVRGARAQRRRSAGARACCDGRPPLGAATRLAAVIGDPGAPLPVAGDPQRGATRRPVSTGSSSRSRCRAGAASTRCGRCPPSGSPGSTSRCRTRRDAARACDELTPAATALELGEHGRARATTARCAATPPTARASCGPWPTRGSTSPAATCSWSAPVARPGRSCGPWGTPVDG